MSGGSQLDVYNLALSYLGLSQRVQNVDEDSAQAGFCNAFYDRARKIVLEQCYWTFATRTVALTLLVDQSQSALSSITAPGWRFVYQRPQDCLKAQGVTTQYGLRVNPFLAYWWSNSAPSVAGPYRPPWTETLDFTGANPGQAIVILTDLDSAWLVYTLDPPNISILPETFIDCVAWQLSTLISGPVSANVKARELAIKMASQSLSRALAQNLNEQQPDQYPESPSIQARL